MSYLLDNPGRVWELLLQHLLLTSQALLIAIAIALPLGALLHTRQRLRTLALGVLGVLYTIPSIALLILLLPLFGLGRISVMVALVIYAQIILVRNVLAGLDSVDGAMLEAARGMGMSGWQRWWKVQLPLALPVLLAGLRIATVVSIGIATIGAKFNAGGLGLLLFEGISQAGRYDKIWAGVIAVGALALALNGLLLGLERLALAHRHAGR